MYDGFVADQSNWASVEHLIEVADLAKGRLPYLAIRRQELARRMAEDDAVAALGWCDCELYGYRWSDGSHLVLDVRHGSGRRGTLRCEHATEFETDLSPAQQGSRPALTWDATFGRTDGRWVVAWDFGGDGRLAFTCRRLLFVAEGTGRVD